ncbi:ATP-binding protein [Noviherbaspirillum aerium]|uniref:ATP-binding protein n=1 Tax=Noviherbaspirillum aerium TaxID=2588497 RepID=UPI001CEF7612|nr:ATP-binding protein [Noviherbaspirillum aerium]
MTILSGQFPLSHHPAFLSGGGEVGKMMRAKDWSASPIGPVATWPQSLRSMLAAVLNSPMLGAVLWGPELLFFYNDAYIPSLGERHPDGIGRPVSEVWGAAWDQVSEPFYQCIATGIGFQTSNVEIPMIRNGQHVTTYWDFSATPIYGEDDTIVGLLNQGVEITARVIADREKSAAARNLDFRLTLADQLRPLVDPDEVIATASELLGKHLDVARVLYAAADESGEILRIKRDWVNGTLASMAGVVLKMDDFGPLIGEAMRAGKTVVIADVMSDERSSSYGHAYASIGIRAFVAIPLIKEGNFRAILTLHDTHPHPWTEHDVALAQDMVDRTWAAEESARAQAELRIERDRSQAVFDTMREGFGMVGRDWTMLYMNAEGLRMGDRSGHQIVGRNHWDIWPEHAGTEVERMYRRVMQTRQSEMLEIQHPHADGTVTWLELRVYPRTDGGLAIFFRDVTSRKEAEEKLRDADRRKDEFLAMLAHELRNPLAPIGAAAELLQMVKLDEARVRQTSQIIGRQVEHMTGLVDDLLDVSRVTQGKVELDKAPLDINHILTDAVEQVSPLVGARQHRLMLDLSRNGVLVSGDKKRLVQVVSNLLTNAAKYTPEGGTILLKTALREDRIHIEVTDNGIGMDKELVERAFDMFTQAERSLDRSSGGLGLGLALVKSLVELHGGTVTCASAGLSQGSTFTVCLPRLLEKPASVGQRQGGDWVQPAQAPLKVMVVDDNVDAAVMLTMLLEAAGHEVLVEHGPYRALERAKADRPKVCLIDIGLPELDGNQVAQRLRSLPEMAHAVLIAVTGYGQENDRNTALAAGFDHHMVKPVDTKHLAAILNAIAVR